MSKRIPFIIGLILVTLGVWIQITSLSYVSHWLNELDNTAYDLQLRAKFVKHAKIANTSIAIVDIDDKSLQEIGRWPWSRSTLADLLNRIQEQGAAVVAFDILFAEKENNIASMVLTEIDKEKLAPPTQIDSLLKKLEPFFDNDIKFAQSLRQIDTVLSISFVPFISQQGLIPPPLLTISTPIEKQLTFYIYDGVIGNIPVIQQAAKSAGFINVLADDDGVIRRNPLLIRYHDSLYPSLALEAARLFLLSKISLVTAPYGKTQRLEGVKIGNNVIPTDDRSQVIIPYEGGSYSFPYFSASDVLNKKIPLNAFDGKIIFVGTSATGLSDLKPTSVENIFPGVEVQATIADGILKNNFYYKPDWALGVQVFLTVLVGLLFTFVFPYFGPRLLALIIILTPPTFVFINNWAWEKTGFIISILVPTLLAIIIGMVNVLYGYFFETRRRERLKEMFGQYVPEKHIDEMLQSKGSYGLYGEDRDMTVLFADIRNFTSISEKLPAAQLKEFLNEVFTPLTEIIFKHRGTIDKYVGDLIMAFWGAPLKDKRHAQHAIATALDMQKKVLELKPLLASKEWPELNIGIGVNSGIMSVGDMGSKFRRNYTVLGDAVNLASRVESLTKHYGVHTIVTEYTRKNQKHFIFREIDRVKVKGKEQGVGIHEVICRISEITPELKNEVQISETALNLYYQQQWPAAKKLFSQLNSENPQNKLYSLYLQRISEFEQNPPATDWDGVYTHTTK